MKLTTKIDISFEEWIDQVKRFADYENDITKATLPKDIETSKEAEINVQIKSLLYPNFNCVVSYLQKWTEKINVPTFDDNGNQNGNEDIEQPNKKVVLSYNMVSPYEEIKHILDAVDALIDSNLKDKERLEATIMKAILLDVVNHKTFKTESYPDGLPEDQYTITH
jgi:hypothetical protein